MAAAHWGTLVSRRRLVQGASVAGLGLLAGCGRLPGQTQESTRIPRIGFLVGSSAADAATRVAAFQEGLRALGYVEGETVTVEYRYGGGSSEQLPELAADLVRLPADVLVVQGVSAAFAAQRATSVIPIVLANAGDAVAAGLVASLARPGGNITGLSMMAELLAAKQLELLKETVPSLSEVAVLWNPTNPFNESQLREVEAAARVLGVGLQALEARSLSEVEAAFAAMTQRQPEGLLVLLDVMLLDTRARIAAFAIENRLPSVYGLRDHVEAGGLMVYAANLAQLYRRAAYYVDRILKGTKPADLPVEQPREFDFVINLRTAQALGLTIPQHVLLQATEVIQ